LRRNTTVLTAFAQLMAGMPLFFSRARTIATTD
jgi:hypothetical protein